MEQELEKSSQLEKENELLKEEFEQMVDEYEKRIEELNQVSSSTKSQTVNRNLGKDRSYKRKLGNAPNSCQ